MGQALAAGEAGQVLFVKGEAGQVLFVKGEASRTGADGRREALTLGTLVFPGDTVETSGGTAQIRFTDHGLVALTARSRFVVNEYIYKGRADGSEKGFFSMLAGGLRAITGEIGKQNKGAYRLSANAATIGIRGTSFQARLCQGDCAEPDGFYVNGGEGEIAVTNGAGEVHLRRGMAAYVRDEHTAPELTQRFPGLALAPPPNAEDRPSSREESARGVTQQQFVASYLTPLATQRSVEVPTPGLTIPGPVVPVTSPLSLNGVGTFVRAGGSSFFGNSTSPLSPFSGVQRSGFASIFGQNGVPSFLDGTARFGVNGNSVSFTGTMVQPPGTGFFTNAYAYTGPGPSPFGGLIPLGTSGIASVTGSAFSGGTYTLPRHNL
jgi:hypothetical protein